MPRSPIISPNDVAIGGALITMVEPDPGREHAYNRWYEDDHFYSGAMHGPWTFAGRRFVAPRSLRDRRAAVESSAVQPPDAGCYISLYWITKGHEEDNERWSFLAMADALMPYGRGFTDRTHVYTAFHRYRFGLVRDPGPMKPHLALDAPIAAYWSRSSCHPRPTASMISRRGSATNTSPPTSPARPLEWSSRSRPCPSPRASSRCPARPPSRRPRASASGCACCGSSTATRTR
jgi:hypothetical protein